MGVMGVFQSDWSDERIERLTKLWREGKSAAEIARLLGGGVTRNAIIGKMHRLGLAQTRTAAAKSETYSLAWRRVAAKLSGRADDRPGDNLKAQRILARGEPQRPSRAPRSLPAAVNVESRPAPLISLRRNQCRFPLDMSVHDESTALSLYCGAPVREEGCPYCAPHAQRAFVRAQPMAKTHRERFIAIRGPDGYGRRPKRVAA